MDNPKVSLRRTKRYGRAVFANKPIRKGEVIAVYDGEIYDNDFDDWTDDLYDHTIQFDKDKWRDSKGLARYINHSCDPNCGIRDLFKVVAMRSIAAGEEITWDYEMTEKNPDWKMKCRCGSPLCRRIIGNYTNMPRKIRKKYEGYISSWLLRGKKKRPRVRTGQAKA
ncbi:MAG: SET domain-containing protein [Bdellovibrionales bacterium]